MKLAAKLALGALGGIVVTYQACGPGFQVAPNLESLQNSNDLASGLPTVKIVSPESNFETRGPLALKGVCVDGSQVTVSGPFAGAVREVACSSGEFAVEVTLAAEDGLKIIVAEQTNSKGTRASDSKSFVLDTLAPAIDFITPMAAAFAKDQLTITGTCENGLPVRVSADSQTQDVSCAQGLFTVSTTLTANDGQVALTVAQTDKAGNLAQKNRSITKDTRPPVLAITAPAREAAVTSPVSISGTCEASLDISISGAGVVSASTTSCSATGTFSTPVNLSAGAGLKAITFSQTDLAGNTGSANHSLMRDDSSPNIRITAPAAGSAARTQVTLQGTCESSLPITVSGSGAAMSSNLACANGTFSVAVALSPGEGTKTLSVSQTGLNGLVGVDSRTFLRDTVAPALTIAAPAVGTATQNTLVLNGSCETGLNVGVSGAVSQSGSVACANGMFSTSITLSTGDGSKTVELSQTDAAGNVTSISRSFVRDTVAPTVAIASPALNALVDATATLTGSCENGIPVAASGTGITAPASFTCASGAYSGQVAFTAGTGSKLVEVSQTDAAGNRSSVSRSFMRNTEGPAINITAPANGIYFQNLLTLQGSCTNGLAISLSGQGYASPASTTCTNGLFSTVVNFTTGDGVKTVIASQVDSLNRTGASSRSFNRDNTAPALAFTSPAAASLVQNTVGIQGSCESGLPVSISGAGVSASSTATCSNGSFSANVTLSAGDGSKAINIAQTDQAGNIGSSTRSFTRDTTLPVLTITSPAANSLFSTSLALQGACESGLAVNVSGTGLAQAVSQTCSNSVYNMIISLSAGDGSKVVNVSQADSAGNTTTVSRTFVRDSTAPQPRILMPAQGTNARDGLTISGSCETGLTVNISGLGVAASSTATCTNSAFSSAIVFSAGNGTKSVSIAQTDAAGNSGSDTRSFVRDTTAPTITIATPSLNTPAQTGLQIAGVCEVGIPVVIWGPGILANASATCTNSMYSQAISFSAGDGTKEIRVSQTDAAGNVTTVSRNFVRDNVAPAILITSPAEGARAETGLTVAGSCENGLAVSIAGAGVSAAQNVPCNSSLFSAQILFSSGDGDKAVTASQTDLAGNRGTVSRMFNRMSAPVALDGAQLYAQNCAGCHGLLATSEKRNRTISQLNNAISTVSQMSSLAVLTPPQREAIIAALSGTSTTPLACAPGDNLMKPQVKRLTSQQFRNSVTNALGNIFTDNQFPAFGDGSAQIGLANDPASLNINEINIASVHESVKSLAATALTRNTTIQSCVAATTDSCFSTIMSSTGLRLWRRPLTTGEISEINTGLSQVTTAGGTRANRMTLLLSALLMSPNHLYRTEIGSGMVAGSTAVLELNHYEIASLLSFAAWDYPPDDTLLNLAAQGALKDVATLRLQVDRLTADPKFRTAYSGYLVDVLKIDGVRNKPKDAIHNLTTNERQALYTSAVNTIENSIPTVSTDFMAPFMTTRFSINSDSARFFNQSSATYSTAFTSVNADPTQRLGILSHPAFLTSIAGQVESGIVKRGVFAIQQLLCSKIPAPPSGAANQEPTFPPGFDPNTATTRQILEMTHATSTSCTSCHSKIDPAGFGFENFSSIGQFRTTEKNNLRIDASGSLAGVAERTLTFSNSIGYIQELTSTTKMRSCMTEKYFNYISGQTLDSNAARCEFPNFESRVRSKGQSTKALIESAVELDSFIRRRPDGT